MDNLLAVQTDLRSIVLAAVVVIIVFIAARDSFAQELSEVAGAESGQSKFVARETGTFAGTACVQDASTRAQDDAEFVSVHKFLQAALTDCGVRDIQCMRVGQVLEVLVIASHFGRVVRGGRAYLLEREATRIFGEHFGFSAVSIRSEADCSSLR